jgi:hypothetical protein
VVHGEGAAGATCVIPKEGAGIPSGGDQSRASAFSPDNVCVKQNSEAARARLFLRRQREFIAVAPFGSAVMFRRRLEPQGAIGEAASKWGRPLAPNQTSTLDGDAPHRRILTRVMLRTTTKRSDVSHRRTPDAAYELKPAAVRGMFRIYPSLTARVRGLGASRAREVHRHRMGT